MRVSLTVRHHLFSGIRETRATAVFTDERRPPSTSAPMSRYCARLAPPKRKRSTLPAIVIYRAVSTS